jgi:hypothetical protein
MQPYSYTLFLFALIVAVVASTPAGFQKKGGGVMKKTTSATKKTDKLITPVIAALQMCIEAAYELASLDTGFDGKYMTGI